MPRIRILPYKAGSRSARALAEALGTRCLRLEGSRFIPREDDVIINWGHSTPPVTNRFRLLNASTRTATDKLAFFRALAGRGLTPEFWTNRNDIPDDAFPIVCRTVLNGHSGRGIVIADTRDQLVDAPLYVKYIKKESEFRIHVGNNGRYTAIISEQRKVRDTSREVADWRIRNHGNGFIFQRHEINVPEAVRQVATQCFESLGLDFGAVDVIFNARSGRAYALEVNTAPGLEGQTVTDYANFFRGLING